jgi:hypothetical protein
MKRMSEMGALGMVAVALLVVSYLAVQGHETATGAIIGVLTAGAGYFMRGKVTPPTT